MIRMTYQVQGMRELRKTLVRAETGFSDFKKPLERSGIEMYKSIDKNFQSQGRPQRWAGHAPLTRKLRGAGARVLMDSGKLRQSVTSKASSGSVYELRSNQLKIGTNLRARGSRKLLGEIHQYGQPAGVHKVFGKPSKRGMPPRPFIMIQDEDVRTIERIFSDYIDEVLR